MRLFSKRESAGREERIRAGTSPAEGAASTGPARIAQMREDRSASGNARMGRTSSEDALEDRPTHAFREESREAGASIQPVPSPMSEVTAQTLPSSPSEGARETSSRVKVVVHRLDGGLEEGESD